MAAAWRAFYGGQFRYEILAQKEAGAKEEIGCRVAAGPFGCHYNGSSLWFCVLNRSPCGSE